MKLFKGFGLKTRKRVLSDEEQEEKKLKLKSYLITFVLVTVLTIVYKVFIK